MKTSVIIPVLNATPWLDSLLPALKQLSPQPDRILFIDSSSTDGTRDVLAEQGFETHVIRKEEFGHGRTRNLGTRLCADSDILIFLTQDAIPASADLVALIMEEFTQDAEAGIITGRQLPHDDATAAARFARLFNYPKESRRVTRDDIPAMGIKALFCSNSFAAYRRTALESVGGFPENLPMGEDLAVAGRLLEAGYASLYCAAICAYHSHNYGIAEEFRRYFDIGALLRVDPWLRERPLKSGGAGLRYVLNEIEFMAREGSFFEILGVFPRTIAKFAGFKLGLLHESLPRKFLPRMSMHRYFWTEAA